jgi:hypothetical protein
MLEGMTVGIAYFVHSDTGIDLYWTKCYWDRFVMDRVSF